MSLIRNSKWRLIRHNLSNLDSFKRSSNSLNAIGDRLYVFGGEHKPRIPLGNELLVFDLNTNKWSVVEPNDKDNTPVSRLGHSSATHGENLYIFGGRTGANMSELSLNDLYQFNTISNKWTKLDSSEESDSLVRPCKRSYHAMTAIKNKLYLFGGCSVDQGRLNDLFEYDLKENKWSKLPVDESICVRGGASLNAFESPDESIEPSCLYLLGGFSGHELEDFYRYDISTQKWSKLDNLPKKLSVFACSSIPNHPKFRLALNGGETDPSALGHNGAGKYSIDTYVYDGSKWHLIEVPEDSEKPAPRGWHAGTSTNKGFFIYGGNLENNERNDELWLLEL